MWTSQNSRPVLLHPFGVDVDHDALAAEAAGGLADELRVAAGRRVDRDLVAAGVQQCADVVDGADAAADGQGHEDHLGRPADHVEDDVAALVAGGDIEEDQLVGPFLLVTRGHLDRIAGVAEVEEVRSLDDPAPVHVKAGNHPFG